MFLTTAQRKTMASAICSAMEDKYKEEGEEGDFEDAYRYLLQDAGDDELHYEHDKWCTAAVK